MRIRKGNFEDLDEIMNIIHIAIGDMENEGIHQWDELYPDITTIKDDIVSETFFVAEDENMIKAFVTLNFDQSAEYAALDWKFLGDNILVVHRLCVNPTCKGRGIARMLMNFAYEHAKAKGCQSIRLDAFPPNHRAIKLYEGSGYKFVGTVTFRKGVFNCYEKKV